MTTNKATWADTLVYLFAPHHGWRGEGQYNLTKLARVAADSLCLQEHIRSP